MIKIVKGIDVNKIKQAIELLTGLSPKETITDERYCLSLGNKNPLEIGYDKQRKLLTEENMSFSAHLKMLSEVSMMMREEVDFLVWVSEQSSQRFKNMENEFKPNGKLEVIHKSGQPYGIRDAGGYLLFFPRVSKYTWQEERYIEEIEEAYALADKIMKALSDVGEQFTLVKEQLPEQDEDIIGIDKDGKKHYCFRSQWDEWRCSLTGYGLMVDIIKWKYKQK